MYSFLQPDQLTQTVGIYYPHSESDGAILGFHLLITIMCLFFFCSFLFRFIP